jgi:hypothetical protein
MTRPIPPDGRLDGPVHGWFGLTYSNYLVLHRAMMQSMPEEWQARAVALFTELDEAFAHIERTPCFIVKPAREIEYGELTPAQRRHLGVTKHGSRYQDDEGEHEAWQRTLIPIGADPVPHYNRGRTYIPPAAGGPS